MTRNVEVVMKCIGNGKGEYWNAREGKWVTTPEEATKFTHHDKALQCWSALTNNGTRLCDGCRVVVPTVTVQED